MKTILHKAATRGHADHGWLDTYHTFSFASYFNPERVHFGALRVLNDDKVAPSEGFGMHPHQNMEVISIPLKGYLRHGDSIENSSVITPGTLQVMSTGTVFTTANTTTALPSRSNSFRYGFSRKKRIPNPNTTTSTYGMR